MLLCSCCLRRLCRFLSLLRSCIRIAPPLLRRLRRRIRIAPPLLRRLRHRIRIAPPRFRFLRKCLCIEFPRLSYVCLTLLGLPPILCDLCARGLLSVSRSLKAKLLEGTFNELPVESKVECMELLNVVDALQLIQMQLVYFLQQEVNFRPCSLHCRCAPA